jgi:hypothetical protein
MTPAALSQKRWRKELRRRLVHRQRARNPLQKDHRAGRRPKAIKKALAKFTREHAVPAATAKRTLGQRLMAFFRRVP